MKKQKKETKKKAVKVKKPKKVVKKKEEKIVPQPIYQEPNVVQPIGDVSEEILVEQPVATEIVLDEKTETEEFVGGIRGTEYKAEENVIRETLEGTSESDRQLTDSQKQKLQFHFTTQINEDDLSGSVAEVISKITGKTQATDDELRMIITS